MPDGYVERAGRVDDVECWPKRPGGVGIAGGILGEGACGDAAQDVTPFRIADKVARDVDRDGAGGQRLRVVVASG